MNDYLHIPNTQILDILHDRDREYRHVRTEDLSDPEFQDEVRLIIQRVKDGTYFANIIAIKSVLNGTAESRFITVYPEKSVQVRYLSKDYCRDSITKIKEAVELLEEVTESENLVEELIGSAWDEETASRIKNT